ncbi:MAG: hypothetical protein CUN55_19275, partial [Phototrophicales bacterium]
MRYRLLLLAFLLTTLLVPVASQERSLVWERWDVVIDNFDPAANSFRVTEQYEVNFSGTFRFGMASIPMDFLEQIRDVQIY